MSDCTGDLHWTVEPDVHCSDMPSGRALIIEERVTVPDAAFDLAGYQAWVTSDAYPQGVRTTYVRGEVLVEMSPESLESHNQHNGRRASARWRAPQG